MVPAKSGVGAKQLMAVQRIAGGQLQQGVVAGEGDVGAATGQCPESCIVANPDWTESPEDLLAKYEQLHA